MTTALTRRGFSPAAQFVHRKAESEIRRIQELNAYGGAMWDELHDVWDECREPNWDGFQARPVVEDTYDNGKRFLESLPLGFPPPSIGADPDGDLTFEWYRSPHRTLSVSVDRDGNLHYAALFGPNTAHGTEGFFGDFPAQIQRLVERVYSE